MVTIAEFDVPASGFVLGRTLSAVPEVRFEVERIAVGNDHEMRLVWVSGISAGLSNALRDDPTVESVTQLSDFGDDHLYWIEWAGDADLPSGLFSDEDATILEASAAANCWELQVLFPERAALSRTYQRCRDRGIDLELLNAYDLSDARYGRFGLTPEQREALVVAYERGYYDVPHRVTTEELGTELGVSHQSVSDRLRRGHRALVEHVLMVGRRG